MTIHEDLAHGTVTIDGVCVPGHIDRERTCSACGSARIYHDDFDAYFCPACNTWLEGACSDPACEYCVRRPAHPLARGQQPTGIPVA